MSQVKQEFTQKVETQQQLISKVESNIGGISDKNQLLQVAQAIGVRLSDPASLTADQVKQEIQKQLPQISESIPEQAQKEQESRTQRLIKRSIKTGSQLIILGVIYILIWYKTRRLGEFLL